FLHDLLPRLNMVAVRIPPLRRRRDEIEGLAREFLHHARARKQLADVEISREALDWMTQQEWPDNIRGLENRIKVAAVVCDDGPVQIEHLRFISQPEMEVAPVPSPVRGAEPSGPSSVAPADEDPVRRETREALERNFHNVTDAARELGISREALHARIRK